MLHDLQGGYFCCFSAFSFSSFVPKLLSKRGGCKLQLTIVNKRLNVITKTVCILGPDLKLFYAKHFEINLTDEKMSS